MATNNLTQFALDTKTPDPFSTTEPPKYKFLYTVQFEFRVHKPFHEGNDTMMSNLFAIRQMGRPSPIINYQDANYYGYRTKVATKTDFATFNMSFYDDTQNRAHEIFDKYMEAVSPITQNSNADSLLGLQTIGELEEVAKLGPIKRIILYHAYRGVYNPKRTRYEFLNPKVTNVMLDELDMTTSEVSSVTLTFNYDSFTVNHDASTSMMDQPTGRVTAITPST